MANEQINYTNPDALVRIGQMNPGTPDNPNIGPLQGAMQGQAWNQMQQFVDLSKQQQQMANQKQAIELSDFAGQTPYRNAAAIGKYKAEGSTGELTNLQNQYAMGRAATDDQIAKLKQDNNIQQEWRQLGMDQQKDMAAAYDAIADKLGPNREITPEAQQAYQGFVQNRNELLPPAQRMDENHHMAFLTPQVATRLTLAKAMVTNSEDTLGKKALIGAETESKLTINGQEYKFKGAQAEQQRALEKELKYAELEVQRVGQENAHRMGILQEEAIKARSQYQENLEQFRGNTQQAVNALSPRQRSLVIDETFNRIFPRTMIDPYMLPYQQGLGAQKKMEGVLGGAGAGPGVQMPQPNIPQPNYGPQGGQNGGAATLPQYSVPRHGDTVRTKEGLARFNQQANGGKGGWELVR